MVFFPLYLGSGLEKVIANPSIDVAGPVPNDRGFGMAALEEPRPSAY